MIHFVAHTPEARERSEEVRRCVRRACHRLFHMMIHGSYTAILALLTLTILVNANDDFVSKHTLLDELLQVFSNYLFHMFSGLFWPSLVSCLPVHVRFRQCMMCRTVKGRRYRSCRRARKERIAGAMLFLTLGCFYSAFLAKLICLSTRQICSALTKHLLYRESVFQYWLVCLSLLKLRCMWYVGRKVRNRLMHSVNGNGGTKGKGKGRGKPVSTAVPVTGSPAIEFASSSSTPMDPQLDVRQQVLLALPDAARLRAQSTLIESEWSVPVVPWQSLGKGDGIAVIPKQFLAEVIRKIGFSGKSIAAVLTQDPDSLGLLGYDRQFLRMNLSTMGPGGDRVITSVKRYVVQLGWGKAVEQVMQGEEVSMIFTMARFTCKMPEALGWPSGPLPAALIVAELAHFLPEEAVDDVQSRHNNTATFMVHSDYTDTLLRASGRRSIFFKESKPTKELLLLWLEDGTSLEEAIKMADHQDAYGVVRKGNSAKPKYAIRFMCAERLKEFAESYSLIDVTALGRWKIYGIDTTVGTYGLLAWLTQRGFQDVEILYVSDGSGVWLASRPGKLDSGYFMQNGTKRQFHIKAVNDVAKDQAKAQNSSSASASKPNAPKQSDRMTRQKAFVASLPGAAANAASSPKKDPSKRKEPPKTGMTPDAKKGEESLL